MNFEGNFDLARRCCTAAPSRRLGSAVGIRRRQPPQRPCSITVLILCLRITRLDHFYTAYCHPPHMCGVAIGACPAFWPLLPITRQVDIVRRLLPPAVDCGFGACCLPVRASHGGGALQFPFGVMSQTDTRPLAYCYLRPSLQSSIRFELGRGGSLQLRVTNRSYIACTHTPPKHLQ
jgi:hypothetical protein